MTNHHAPAGGRFPLGTRKSSASTPHTGAKSRVTCVCQAWIVRATSARETRLDLWMSAIWTRSAFWTRGRPARRTGEPRSVVPVAAMARSPATRAARGRDFSAPGGSCAAFFAAMISSSPTAARGQDHASGVVAQRGQPLGDGLRPRLSDIITLEVERGEGSQPLGDGLRPRISDIITPEVERGEGGQPRGDGLRPRISDIISREAERGEGGQPLGDGLRPRSSDQLRYYYTRG